MTEKTKWDYSKYPGSKKYPNLFKPVKMGSMEIPNRIKYAATEDNLNAHDGFVTDVDVAYIRERAKGVVGGICTIQGVYMDSKTEGKGYVGQAAAWDDKFIPGLKKLADAIHEEGALANYQLMHCGRVGGVELPYCVGPSAMPQRLRIFRNVREMSHTDIKRCINEHADAARRGIDAGFDIMEVSGIVGYLVSNFLSSYTNRRTDEYGGDIESRCKFMVETIENVREVVGKDVPILIRLCADELLNDVGGNTPEESMVTYKMAEKAGVDCISVTQGWQESGTPVITRDVPQGSWLFNAKRAKEAGINVPISMAYRLFDPKLPDKAIADGNIDIWEMCRPMIADPLMPKKVLEGREEDIRPCVACNLCLARLFRDAPLTCYVNPMVAHEWDPKWQIKPAEKKKKVAVVGGGPAGLECARAVALKGHEVHLYEKNSTLGGQINFASKAPFGDEELFGLIKFLETQCKKANVHMHLGTEVTPAMLKKEKPDTIVIATGARFSVGEIPGYDKSRVVSSLDILDGKAKTGNRVIVWGGRKPGIAAALFLAKAGKKVTMVTGDRKVGKDVNPSYIWRYVQKLNNYKVNTYKEATLESMSEGEVVVRSLHETRIPVQADTIVYADREPLADLTEGAKKLGADVQVIGDALVPRGLSHAVHDGYRTGMRI